MMKRRVDQKSGICNFYAGCFEVIYRVYLLTSNEGDFEGAAEGAWMSKTV